MHPAPAQPAVDAVQNKLMMDNAIDWLVAGSNVARHEPGRRRPAGANPTPHTVRTHTGRASAPP